jgi:hypothetical protein
MANILRAVVFFSRRMRKPNEGLGMISRVLRRWASVLYLAAIFPVTLAHAEPMRASVTVHADRIQRTVSRRMLTGSNLAMWNQRKPFVDKQAIEYMRDLGPGILRIPGGSWGDIVFWNGNGVRRKDNSVDASRFKDGYPQIDYSDYAPSILVNTTDHPLKTWIPDTNWHGNHDIQAEHEYISQVPGCETLAIVNAGTGRPLDAAEWVRWANKKKGYDVRYWEIGNALDNVWEAGHYLPDGREMTGEMYAKRFAAFSNAMRTVDPSIKIGGVASIDMSGDFTEAMLRDAGNAVDFVSYHLYLGEGNETEEELIGKTIDSTDMDRDISEVRSLVRKYQPLRADKIEIGISEWNLFNSSKYATNSFGMLFSALFVGKMMEAGVDFACQFQAIGSYTELIGGWPPFSRREEYWGLWLWNHYMGDSLLQCEKKGVRRVRAFCTKSEDAIHILLANSSRDESALVSLDVQGAEVGSKGQEISLTYRDYFWNPIAHKVEWSNPPVARPIKTGRLFTTILPPFSVQVIEVPLGKKTFATPPEPVASDTPPYKLQLALPKSIQMGDYYSKGWVLAKIANTTKPYPFPIENVNIRVTGAATVDRESVRLSESAGRFMLTPISTGNATVQLIVDGKTQAQGAFTVVPAQPRPIVLWEFENKTVAREISGEFPIHTDSTVHDYHRALRIELSNTKEPSKLLEMPVKLPDPQALVRSRVIGAFFDMYIPDRFTCDDPDASIEIRVRDAKKTSISLGSSTIADARKGWHTFKLKSINYSLALTTTTVDSVQFLLHSSKPANGPLYIDRVGFVFF